MTRTKSIRTSAAKLAAIAAAATLALSACSSSTTAQPGSSGSSGKAAASLACPTGKLIGEGSSAQKNAIDEIIAAYGEACGKKATIEYNPTGSGAGIKNFNAGLVDFGGSDSALKTDEATAAKTRCATNEAWNLPMVVGPVAFSYNLSGVSKLVLTPSVLAKIFTGKITTWNDPAIAAINKDAKLPADKITVFYRSDESGTTENVTRFLKASAPSDWTTDASKSWKGAGEGKNKSSGVAESVKATSGAIGYLEWSYATDNKLGVAALDLGSGAVELTSASVGKAVESAKLAGTGNDLKLEVDYATKAAGAYPAILVTYEIVCSAGLPADKTALLKDFLGFFSSAAGQKDLESLGYAPLPESMRTKVAAAVGAIK